MLLRKSFCAFPDEINMRALAQDFTCRSNGISDVFDAADASRAEGGAVHHQSIKLHFAFAIQKAAAPGVKGFVIFHYDNRFLDCIKSCATLFQNPASRGDCVPHAIQMCFNHVAGNGPRAAVNQKNRVIAQSKFLGRNWSV